MNTPESSVPPSNPHIKKLTHLRSLSYVLDNAISIPGTSYRIGLDPLIGLIPGVGDIVGAGISFYIVLQAARMGVSQSTLYRMTLNIIVETLVGAIPIFGDLFDASWKANAKNVALLERYLNSPQRREQVDCAFIAALLMGLMLAVICVVAFTVIMLRLLFQF